MTGRVQLVCIELTVMIDPDEWADEYGIEHDHVTVREDVRRWATDAMSRHPVGLVEIIRDARGNLR